MSHEPENPSPEARRALDAVKALACPMPEASYRARMKQAFVSGAITAPAPAAGRVVRLPWWPARPWGPMLAPAAAAAAIVAVALMMNRGPAWQVMDAPGEGILIVDATPIPLGHRDDLARALRPGARIRLTSTETVDLAIPGQMVVQLTPSTDMILPASAGRWMKRRIRAEVRSGEVRFTTGPDFRGARLHVETPEADVMVTGTTLAVIREPHGTCVCVMDGAVEMGPRGGTMARVEAGRRRFVFSDGRAPEQDAMRPMERLKLGMFREQYGERMEKAAR